VASVPLLLSTAIRGCNGSLAVATSWVMQLLRKKANEYLDEELKEVKK